MWTNACGTAEGVPGCRRRIRGTPFWHQCKVRGKVCSCGEGWTGSEGSGEEVNSLEHPGEEHGMRILGTTDFFSAQ